MGLKKLLQRHLAHLTVFTVFEWVKLETIGEDVI